MTSAPAACPIESITFLSVSPMRVCFTALTVISYTYHILLGVQCVMCLFLGRICQKEKLSALAIKDVVLSGM